MQRQGKPSLMRAPLLDPLLLHLPGLLRRRTCRTFDSSPSTAASCRMMFFFFCRAAFSLPLMLGLQIVLQLTPRPLVQLLGLLGVLQVSLLQPFRCQALNLECCKWS